MDDIKPIRKKPGTKPIPDEVCEEALARMEDGEGPYAVATDLGWHPMSLSRAIRRDPAREARYLACHKDAAMIAAQRADELADEAEQAWRNCSMRGEPSLLNSALNHWSNVAKRRDPRLWGDRQQVEHSGEVIQTNKIDVSCLTLEQKEAMALILKKKTEKSD